MIRGVVALTLLAGAGSFFSFKNGGTIAGVFFALVALATVVAAAMSIIGRRNGHQMRWSSNAKIVGAVAGVILLAGTAYSIYWLVAAPKAGKDLRFTSKLDSVCSSRYFPDAAKFDGPGPHPIVAFYEDGVGSSLNAVRFNYDDGPAWNNNEAKQIQLVACLTDFERGAQVGECKFKEGTAPLFTGTFKGTLFTTNDRKKVADLTVPARATANENEDCPTLIYIKGEVADQKFNTRPDPVALRQALGPHVG